MTTANVLSKGQLQASEFDDSEYKYNLQPGEFTGIIDLKRWDKGRKLVTYMTFEDGRKIIALTWPRSNHEGLTDMEIGSKVRVTYMESRNGMLVIRRTVLLESPKLPDAK